MKCEVKSCNKKARFYTSSAQGLRAKTCGYHLIKLVRKFRPLIWRGHTALFIQKFNPNAPGMEAKSFE